jgi:hypothetical protein
MQNARGSNGVQLRLVGFATLKNADGPIRFPGVRFQEGALLGGAGQGRQVQARKVTHLHFPQSDRHRRAGVLARSM